MNIESGQNPIGSLAILLVCDVVWPRWLARDRSEEGVPVTTYIALLRGINVSGHRLIKMSDLRQMFISMGFDQVQTYIQSGNVLFQSAEEATSLRHRIEQEIEAVFGFDVPVLLRTAGELEQILQNCPFPVDGLQDGSSLYVTLLAGIPSADGINRLQAVSSGADEYRVVGREIYILYRQPVHKSKLTNNLFEQRLRVSATTRNWQTMSKLAQMAKVLATS